MLCPSCGHDNLPGADDCEECLAALTQEDIPLPTSKIEHSMMSDCISSLNPAEAVSVADSAKLGEAVALMRKHRIGCVLATDAGGALSGILSERDLLNKVAGKDVDLDSARVADFMTHDPETLTPEHWISFALNRMEVGGFRHLPIVGKDGPPGIISSRDIINYFERHFHEMVTKRYTREVVQEKLKKLARDREPRD